MKQNVNINAGFTMVQTEDACEQVQRGGFQLENISTTTIMENDKAVPKNKAVFHNEFSDKILNELSFVSLETEKPDAVNKKMKDEGRTPICDSEIFVAGKLTRVLVFGKKVAID